MSINDLTVDDDSASDTCTEGNHDKILHTPCSTIGHLTYGSGIRVIRKGYRKSVHSIREELGKLDCLAAAPRKVNGILDSTCIIVSVRSSDTDSTDVTFASGLLYNLVQGLSQFGNVRLYICISICTDDCLGKHSTSRVNHAELGSLAADINSNYKL